MRHTFIIHEKWHEVIGPSATHINNAYRWCKAYNSDGEFHTTPATPTRLWYFENEKDAIMFALKWGK